MNKFKADHEFEKRLKEANKIRAKYPDRVPVIIHIDNSSVFRSQDLPEIDKIKYLVPTAKDFNLGSFLFVIRKRMKLPEQVAIYPYIKEFNVIPIATELMSTIYDKYADKDGFLYLDIVSENFFG
jgi:GABA(A) receptor-associated protein